jgi:hypothetical protein
MRTFLREAECVLCGIIFGRPRNEKTEQQKLSENREFLNVEGGGEIHPHTHKKEKARVIFVRILAHRK